MTTLCRCDWIEANARHELQAAQINLRELPTTSFEKMVVNSGVKEPSLFLQYKHNSLNSLNSSRSD